jgi:3-demethoxyubiquinol 3-hydroxylase
MVRQFSWSDQAIFVVDQALKTLCVTPGLQRDYPAKAVENGPLSKEQQSHSAALMRINHVGEVCAQGLYLSGYLFSHSPSAQNFMLHSMEEEKEHLSWTSLRLDELNSRVSLLNPVWFMGSFLMGFSAAWVSDEWSYTFVEETELQVGEHLAHQLEGLPREDLRSRSIVTQMYEDEMSHAKGAQQLGSYAMPEPYKQTMKGMAKVMKAVAYYV